MKGAVKVYFDMPNVAKFRSRVANPSKELTSQVRGILAGVVAETMNESILKVRTKFINEVSKLGIEYTSEAHKAKVESMFEGFFDAIFSVEKFAGADDAEETAADAEPAAPATEKKADDWD